MVRSCRPCMNTTGQPKCVSRKKLTSSRAPHSASGLKFDALAATEQIGIRVIRAQSYNVVVTGLSATPTASARSIPAAPSEVEVVGVSRSRCPSMKPSPNRPRCLRARREPSSTLQSPPTTIGKRSQASCRSTPAFGGASPRLLGASTIANRRPAILAGFGVAPGRTEGFLAGALTRARLAASQNRAIRTLRH